MVEKTTKPPMKTSTKAGGIAAALAAAALVATPLISKWEGRRLNPYLDIVQVWTVCDGETRVEMRRYTHAECDALTAKAIESDFGPVVLRCTPALAARPRVLAAAISLAYNIGAPAYCRSTVARRFNAGDWRGACTGFLAWNRAGGRVVAGLTNRRREESALCLSGIEA
jgi:lysozyme